MSSGVVLAGATRRRFHCEELGPRAAITPARSSRRSLRRRPGTRGRRSCGKNRVCALERDETPVELMRGE
ncbi:unnamed protein product [Nesidiocoris tenuis]|uniref:Uncharacterized protein n=1 Tax=Nesidiocoris tenuis TaxID=355587 RepID=A0A6H5HJM1_9HEMI|nr:unnamed protein product [Nesidiocoris tenuis]